MTIYHAGYTAVGAPEYIHALMKSNSHLLLIETRKAPFSKPHPEFKWDKLERKYGKRYRKKAGEYLGNRNYNIKGAPIEIIDLDTGVEVLISFLRDYDILLLCQCADISRCHRRMILDALRERVPLAEIIEPVYHVDKQER
jgi:uncharacterized protein (DUF488 family)